MHQSCTGFTLFEILISIVIFVLVVTTIFGSYNFIFSNAEGMLENVASYEMAKNCLDRMAADLRSVYVVQQPEYKPPNAESPPDDYRMVGDIIEKEGNPFSRLRFTSLSHLLLEGNVRDGIAENYYYVTETEDRGFVLKRSDSLYPYSSFEEKATDPILCEHVKLITFLFYDQEGAEYNFWDSDSEAFGYATPRAIRIKLGVGDTDTTVSIETMVTIPVYRKKMET